MPPADPRLRRESHAEWWFGQVLPGHDCWGTAEPHCLAWFQRRDLLPFWMNGTGKKEGWQRGWHGYDNELMDMRGIFLAFGPGRWGTNKILLVIRSQGCVPRGAWRESRLAWFLYEPRWANPAGLHETSFAGSVSNASWVWQMWPNSFPCKF